jgi:transglutaminase-like putative cysteine protease
VFVKILLILELLFGALNIPARYFTCYATNINPPDIHACFEVYIGGQWILFDPT